MKKYIVVICSIFLLAAGPIRVSSAHADDLEQVLKRLATLEREHATLEQENAALRERVRRLEGKRNIDSASPQRVIMDAKLDGRVERQQSSYAVYKAAPPVQAPFTWTGLYLGGHIGWAQQIISVNDPFSIASASDAGVNFATAEPIRDVKPHGFFGGAQAGWNYQIGRIVLGNEISISSADVRGSRSDTLSVAGTFSGATTTMVDTRAWSGKTDLLTTATTRLGLAWDTWLFYTKAGMALSRNFYTSIETRFANTVGGPFPNSGVGTTVQTGTDTRAGWTVGAGVEWGFSGNWSATAEYDYIEFGSRSVAMFGASTLISTTGSGTNSTSQSLPIEQRIQAVKLGLNYRFEWPSDTLVAKY
jgi:outer membrane immunogenic protein